MRSLFHVLRRDGRRFASLQTPALDMRRLFMVMLQRRCPVRFPQAGHFLAPRMDVQPCLRGRPLLGCKGFEPGLKSGARSGNRTLRGKPE